MQDGNNQEVFYRHVPDGSQSFSGGQKLIEEIGREITLLKKEISQIENRMAKTKIFCFIWTGVMALFLSSV
ncbi:hypothetical protein CE91St46_13060 [Eubacteriales bacterium]|nr:hypothetical protein [Faecalicatena sp. BF-R-105]GKH50195.1 hypothetical protein CE91St46_13060 [Eubacteriales bacterium]GKH62832.1 hypothetical protein CE91St47_13010 [Eubacteriales bacterium]